ncbi:hypothetical protein ABZV61_39750 [Streptomyces sp900116325]|uniref:Transposase n=1 Tax=Streptomyces sp. 900116325 TaxID=3154295 RepID=A0ABV2ULK8_9ACTN
MLVARLLELDAAGALTTAQVRAGAQVGGANVRTVWRWLEAARAEGRVERRRRLKAAGGEVPSVASLYRVVRRDLQASRVLPDRAVVRLEREEQRTRHALADLALAGLREGGAVKAAVRRPPALRAGGERGLAGGGEWCGPSTPSPWCT